MPAPRDGVLIVGSINADLTAYSSRLPQPGETFTGDAFALGLGGKGANQAVAVAKAGAAAHMVGCVGDDRFGSLVTSSLGEHGVRLEHVRTVAGDSADGDAGSTHTGIAHIRVAGGENDIVIVAGANASLDEAQLDAAFAALGDRVAVMLTQLETPLEITLAAVRRAHDAGITVILDPAPARALPEEIWPLVDIIKPNETEAALLTGLAVDSAASAAVAGRWFVERGVDAAIITMAGAGSVLVTAEGVSEHAPIAVEVVDTTAAGDAYAGHLAASIAAGLGIDEAIRRASAAGAVTVTRRGASASLASAAEVDALLQG
ncbi:ribokinase [Agrococcus sp. ARC_14]|uniref:ribokinase n=1 Tax=Agrococcus sp. ARC_14 TaxID=2919927 RepID=UPI001F054000|nr:ribokinase [Agrococcus sp. ARC_14]MCH1881489.1 ribokinase [Agrococcus sp. ARC_14]